MEDVEKRISELIQKLGISNSEFADSIDLPRPILSHILSGRNKPSLLVVQKIASKFPDVSINWLLLGGKEELKKSSTPNTEATPTLAVKLDDETEFEHISPDKSQNHKPNLNETVSVQSAQNQRTELTQIVHYYKDGTFKVFTPR